MKYSLCYNNISYNIEPFVFIMKRDSKTAKESTWTPRQCLHLINKLIYNDTVTCTDELLQLGCYILILTLKQKT